MKLNVYAIFIAVLFQCLMGTAQAQTLPCNYRTLTVNNYPNAGVVNGRTGGVGGFLGFGAGNVANAANVADATLTNSATINAALGSGSGGQISVNANQTGGTTVFGAGAIAGFVLGNNSSLGSNLLPSTTIRTYLNGTLQESSSSSTLMNLPQLAGTGQIAVGFMTTRNFDEIQIVIANVVSVASSTPVFFPFVQYSNLQASATVTNSSSASSADGGVMLTVSGGRTPYRYAWSTGATTQSLTNVAPGSYTVTVTDANTCTVSTTATVGVKIAPCPVPGQNGFTAFSFPTPPTVTGQGVGRRGRYPNVANIGGQSVDMIGEVITYSGIADATFPRFDNFTSVSGATLARYAISGLSTPSALTSTVRWTLVRAGTNTPVPFQGSFTVGDIDNDVDNGSLESVIVNKSDLFSYKLSSPTNTTVISTSASPTIRFQGTQNQPGTDGVNPAFTVGLAYVGVSSFDITYSKIGTNAGTANFPFDGQGGIVFGATTCVPVLDTDGDTIPNATDIDDDNDGILDDTEGLLTDADSDGISNALDLDSDGDGIPDNIEAQTTSGFIAPGTTVTASGLPTAYSATGGLTPVNTDGTDTADYIDTDSDNDTKSDTSEANLTLAGVDTDKDGLDNNIDTNDTAFGPANAGITNPLSTYPSNGSQVFWRIKEGAFIYANCANATVAGTFVIGVPSTGVLTIPITTVRDGQIVVASLTGPGFTSVPASVTTSLASSQTALSIPIAYDGSGAVGTRTLSVSSAQATGSCSPTVAVIGLADITTSIGLPTPSLLVGQTSSLPIAVSNVGSAATTGTITTTLVIPANVTTPPSFTSNGFACATTGSNVTCTYSTTIASGSSTTFAVPITPGVATAGTTLTFTHFVSITAESSVTNNIATLTVVVSSSVTANPDSGTVSSGTGGVAIANVVTNDIVNTQPATLGAGGNATVSPIGTYPAGITLNPTTGSVSVAVGTRQGSYTITYQLCDRLTPTTCATTTATITVTALAPIVTGDITITRPNTPVSGNVLTNDRDPQGLPLTVTLLGLPSSGTVTLNPNGSYTFTPPANFTGVASFCYSASNSAGLSASTCVTIDVEPDSDGGNSRPVATNDNIRSYQNTAVTVAVLANDTDPNAVPPNSVSLLAGQLANPTLVSQPAQGTATVNGDGTITYTPPTNYTGSASFNYQVCDRATPALCATATVTINVLPTPPAATTLSPVSVDDLLLTQLNGSKTGSVSANDYDPQGLALSYSTGQPGSGTVVMSATGSYTYTPAPGFTGPTSFTYQVCNTAGRCDVATVSVLVQPLPPSIRLLPQVYLQGALFGVSGSLMRDDLRAAGYLPPSNPYAAFNPQTPVGNMAPSVTAITGNNAIVDWVFVELHSASLPATVVDSRAALLQRDGDIVEVDGVSSLTFAQTLVGSYYVAVRHRNHLGVMSQSALPLSTTAITVDFRNPNTPVYTNSGTTSYTQIAADQAQVIVQQGVAMWAGNSLNDNAPSVPRNLIIFQGSNNDVNQLYQQVTTAPGNILTTPFYKLRGYQVGDVNLDGQVIFQGTGNDVEFIYQNIVKNHPGNSLRVPFFIIREQVP